MLYNILNKAEFEQELENAGDKLVIIDFYANWCGSCKIINPQLEELSQIYGDKTKMLIVNVDDCEEIAMAYNITSMPTFVFIKSQEILDVLVGGNIENLTKNIEKYIEQGEKSLETKYLTLETQNMVDDEDILDIDDLGEDPTSMLEVIVDE